MKTKFASGDEVLGWTERRAAQAEYVAGSPSRLILKPAALDWFRTSGPQKYGAKTDGSVG